MIYLNLQAANLKSRGLKTGVLGIDNEDHLVAGQFQIVFSSPEMLFLHKRWRDMLTSNVYFSQLQAFVVDEAHTCKKW